MKSAILFVAAALLGCSHGADETRASDAAQVRQYREAYESQMQQIAQLKSRIAELERRDCR
jgi:hypothetical protein